MGYTLTQAKAFIEQIAPLIVAEGTKRGYKVFSTTIAQAIVESAANTSSLGYKYANYFGMKCGSSWRGGSVNLKTKEEYTLGTLTTIKDNFRTYLTDGKPGMAKGVAGYYDFISAKRYANLKEAKDYKQFAEFLKADGYATSSTYVNTLIKTVEKYSLQIYDIVDAVPPVIVNRRTLKRGMSGEDVKLVQQILMNNGYDLGKWGADGQFGAQTEKIIKQFQNEKGLVVDGIVGKKTWLMLEQYN
ncbi:MAG: peptidoglycan-binding protein [Clostridium sp.]|nr:peptidoglycan-binding protein [Clostridium sp.]